MHVIKANVNGNPNIGLYGFATDKFCFLGNEVSELVVKEIEEVLNVPIFQLNLAGTSLIGVFMTGNEENILIPDIAFDSEIENLKNITNKLGVNLHIINTKLTALGNNIACNLKGCMINPEFSEDVKQQVAEALNLPVKEGKIAGLPTVGSLLVMNKKGCAIHRDAEDFEINFVKSIFNVETETGTVNMGNPFLSSGILANTNGFVVGNASGGPEITYLDETLGFIEG